MAIEIYVLLPKFNISDFNTKHVCVVDNCSNRLRAPFDTDPYWRQWYHSITLEHKLKYTNVQALEKLHLLDQLLSHRYQEMEPYRSTIRYLLHDKIHLLLAIKWYV